MKLSRIKPLSYFKAHAPDVIRDIANTRSPMVLTVNGEAKVVVMDMHSYEETQETLALFSLMATGDREFAEGKFSPAKDAMTRIRAKLKS